MPEFLEFTFMQNALLSALLVSIAAGIIGSLVVVNKISFLSGGIAHSSYGGIGFAVYFGLPILFGATLSALLAALIIALLTMEKRDRIDSLIGMIWAAGMAIGIIFIDLTAGYNVDLLSYLFGSILAVSKSDLYYILILDIVIIALISYYYREFLSVSYDSEFAKLRGINVKLFYSLILILAALTIVALMRIVGLILVIALLTIPPYLAENFANKLSKMIFLSTMFSCLFSLSGLIISYYTDISSGACIIVVAVATYFLVKLGKRFEKNISK